MEVRVKCGRKVCDNEGRLWNSVTLMMYCPKCSRGINEFNPGLCTGGGIYLREGTMWFAPNDFEVEACQIPEHREDDPYMKTLFNLLMAGI